MTTFDETRGSTVYYRYEVRCEEGGRPVCECWQHWMFDDLWYMNENPAPIMPMRPQEGSDGWERHMDAFLSGLTSGYDYDDDGEFEGDARRMLDEECIGYLAPWDVGPDTCVGFYWFCE